MKRYLEKLANCLPILILLFISTFISTITACAGIASAAIYGINVSNIVTIILGTISTFFVILASLDGIITEMMYS